MKISRNDTIVWAGCALVILVGSCKKSEEAAPAAAAPAAAAPVAAAPAAAEAKPAAPGPSDEAAAKELFASRCSTCHGPVGKGDGPASAGLVPKPAHFSDPAWQKSVTDEHIEKIIVYGGSAVGKSPAMPPNPDLDSKPALVKALRAHIRSLKQ